MDGTLAQLPARTSSALIGSAVLEPTEGGPGAFRIVAEGTTPERAVELARELGEQLGSFSSLDLIAAANRQAAAIHDALPDTRPGSPRRRRLTERLERLFPLRFEQPPPRLALGAPPEPSEPEAWADSVVDALPGPFPPRPSPLWVGLAGVLLTVAAWVLWPCARGRHPG